MTTYLKNFVDSTPCSRRRPLCRNSFFNSMTMHHRSGQMVHLQRDPLGSGSKPALCVTILVTDDNGGVRVSCATAAPDARSGHELALTCLQARSCCRRSCKPASHGCASSTPKRSGCRRRAPPRWRRGCCSSSRCGPAQRVFSASYLETASDAGELRSCIPAINASS